MRKVLVLLWMLVQVFATQPAFAQSEIEVRGSVGTAVAKAFLSKNYSQLELLAKQYRDTKARTPSGVWKLSVFYVAISDAINRATNENPQSFAGVDSIAADWVAAYPKSPTAHIVQSLVMYCHGIAFRGESYAKDVDPVVWKPFREQMALSRANLEKYKAIASLDPEWYELMLIIGRNEAWEKPQFKALLDEALKREPGFYQTYFAALDYLSPKWAGSVAEVEEFATASATQTVATEGSGMYARIYWYASQRQIGHIFLDGKARWPAMRKGFDDIVAKYPDSWNMNHYAFFACLANDMPKTKELLAMIRANDLIPQAWGGNEGLQICRRMAASS